MTVAPERPDWPLRAYRTVAIIVGIGLPILLVGAIYGLATAHGASVSKAAGRPTAVEVVGPIHGFLYIALLLLALTLSFRERWPIGFTLLVCLAGTVPFASFVAERAVTRRVRGRRRGRTRAPGGAAGAATHPPRA